MSETIVTMKERDIKKNTEESNVWNELTAENTENISNKNNN